MGSCGYFGFGLEREFDEVVLGRVEGFRKEEFEFFRGVHFEPWTLGSGLIELDVGDHGEDVGVLGVDAVGEVGEGFDLLYDSLELLAVRGEFFEHLDEFLVLPVGLLGAGPFDDLDGVLGHGYFFFSLARSILLVVELKLEGPMFLFSKEI